MARWLSLLVLVASPFVLDGTAHALRCGTRLVANGDPMHYVRSICGEPASIQVRTVTRSRTVAGRVVAGVVIGDSVAVTVAVEEWIYDFGPRRFMEQLTFEDGWLVQQRPLSYGTQRRTERVRPRAPDAVALVDRRRAVPA